MLRIGVVVGRFQVPKLTSGHETLLRHVASVSDSIVVVIGRTVVRGDPHDPLPFECVNNNIRNFLLKLNKPFVISALYDHPSDATWSKNLDEIIKTIKLEDDVAVLHGSRDSFFKCYSGQFQTVDFEAADSSSGTKDRSMWQSKTGEAFDILASGLRLTPAEAFNAGIIHGSSLLYPISYQCVDIIAHDDNCNIILIKKPGHDCYQLPGGFVDVNDETLEDAARRELQEETGIIANTVHYHISARIDDFRYRNRRDKIMTSLFIAPVTTIDFKYAKGSDDAEFVKISSTRLILKNELDLPVLSGHLAMIESWARRTGHV